jgi:hypothetical protein
MLINLEIFTSAVGVFHVHRGNLASNRSRPVKVVGCGGVLDFAREQQLRLRHKFSDAVRLDRCSNLLRIRSKGNPV